MNKTIDFIKENFDKTVRCNPTDNEELIGLPKPYTVPCIDGAFQEMYYWDTFFTNVGLIIIGNTTQAKNNCDNMAFLINKYGFMPNGNRTWFLNRSQPPFFTKMICDVYEKTGDREWLENMYKSAKTEYEFWQTKRLTTSGLNRYYGTIMCSEADYLNASKYTSDRMKIKPAKDFEEAKSLIECMLSFCESGWDCNSRYGLKAHEFNPIELNALLFGMEKDIAFFARELQKEDSDIFESLAEKRKRIINELCWSEKRGTYFDYDFINKTQNRLFSAAAFYPLFVGLASETQAKRIVSLLPLLENDYGIACCEKSDDLLDLQWDYPHGWACLHYIIIMGLLNYGFREHALRIAKKYLAVVDMNFEKTQNIWEKYNTITGEISATKEYDSPKMMGWSAGVYLFCHDLLNHND